MRRQYSGFKNYQANPDQDNKPQQCIAKSVIQPIKQSEDGEGSKQPINMMNTLRRISLLEQKYEQILIEQKIQAQRFSKLESTIPVESVKDVKLSIGGQQLEQFSQKDIVIQRMIQVVEESKHTIAKTLFQIQTKINNYKVQVGFQLKSSPEFMEIEKENKLIRQQIKQLIDEQQNYSNQKQQNQLDSQLKDQASIQELNTQVNNIKIQNHSFGTILQKHTMDINCINLWKQDVQGQTTNIQKCSEQISNINSQSKWQQDQIKDLQITLNMTKILPANANIFKKQSINNFSELKKPSEQQLLSKVGDIMSTGNQQEQVKNIRINQAKKLINQLYDLSCSKRGIPEEFKAFVGRKYDFQELLVEYGATGQFQQLLATTFLDGFRRVRADGNCFYTAFIFQYLLLILSKQDDQRFEQLLKNVKSIKFQLIYEEGFSIPEATQSYLQAEFLQKLQILRDSDNTEKALEAVFGNYQDIFYGLAIIYIRNLVYQLYSNDRQEQQSIDESFDKNLITTWESQCDQIAVVKSLLARHLDLQIIIYQIANFNCIKQIYGEEGRDKIFLIHNSEHYQIGIEYIHRNLQQLD